jgi:photosystem II stability/assembly factor-like uncharacterized protein
VLAFIRIFGLAACAVLSLAALGASPQWNIQYFYDRDDGRLAINDLRFFSAQRGVAVGYVEEGGRTRPMSIVTADGGATWKEVKLKEPGVALFSINETLGWMVTDRGIWKTADGGESWSRLKKIKGINRVWFLSESHGFAVGAPKLVYETTDGGENWAKVEEAGKPQSNPHSTSYDWITFVTPERGLIIGASVPMRPEDAEPAWFDPQSAATRRETPTMMITLETQNGGKSWTAQTAPTFGQTTRVRLLPTGFGLALIQFAHSFDWPSEVFKIVPNGKSERVYREKNRVVTDCAVLAPNEALLATIDPPGRLYQLGIPGKLHILHSKGLSEWKDMTVDYKATATRAIFSVIDRQHMWVATDTGMILSLSEPLPTN